MEKDFNASARDPGLPPLWDLSSLFPGPATTEFSGAVEQALAAASRFAENYSGKVAGLPPARFGEALSAYEEVSGNLALITAYAGLVTATDAGRMPWQQGVTEKLKPAMGNLLFFTLEIARMDEGDLLDKLTAPGTARFIPFLRGVRDGRNHLLSDELEQFLVDMSPVSSAAWARLYTQTEDELRFDHKGEKLTAPAIAGVISSAADPALRRSAWEECARVYAANKSTFSLIVNTLADIKSIDDRWRKFDDPAAARHMSNQIEPAVVDAMMSAVRESCPRLSHRYYAWKAEKLGQSRLHPADRNAPLQGGSRAYGWDEARKTVLQAFDGFSPEFSKIAGRFFDEGRIDAKPRPGKAGGAFCADTGPLGQPFVLMNFFGAARDVKTLAHELGHGIHQVLAAAKGALMSDTPLPLAETASVFAEMLVFRAMLDAENDPVARRAMLAATVEDMLNTVVRQAAFHQFEVAVHTERREKGELTPERLDEIYIEIQKESLGPAVDMNVRNAGGLWAAVPHFVQSPFYVYAYAAGGLFVNALYETFEKAEDKDDFKAKYADLLSAGGTKRHRELLAPFGLDPAEPAFWQRGLDVIERHIDELIALDRAIEAGLAPPSSSKKMPGMG